MLLFVVQVTDGQFVASSPDERAIMEACFHHGLVYNGELADGRLSVTVQGRGSLLLILCREAKGRFSPCFWQCCGSGSGIRDPGSGIQDPVPF